MKNVAFYINPNNNWLGGVNYYRNLFKALSLINNNFNYYLFISEKGREFHFEEYCSFQIIYDNNLLKDIKTTLNNYIDKYNINFLSHMNIFSDVFKCKIINWIPDFQHKYLEEFFSKEEIKTRNEKFYLYSKYADKIILSSQDAFKDFSKFIPEFKNKGVVLNFSPFLDLSHLTINKNKNKFFFLPNQFWQHKNHIIVFKAIKLLKDRGINIQVYCTGSINDYRNNQHIEDLLNFINKNDLNKNIHILGIIPYLNMIEYMIDSIAVINPSVFEGWSSTVEECKILNKFMLLSNIPIHKEQAPIGIFFNPKNKEELANLLLKRWTNNLESYNSINIQKTNEQMIKKLKIYATNYENILKSIE